LNSYIIRMEPSRIGFWLRPTSALRSAALFLITAAR
jgi:hypothetical protein